MKKLTTIQNELKVPKANINKFGNYKYRSAEDILEAVKPILLKHQCTLTLSDDIVSIGSKIFLKACATFQDLENAEAITIFGFAETSEHKGMSAEQTTGTASSYARKYALNGLFLIDETEQDADSQNPQEPKVNKPQEQSSDKQWLNIWADKDKTKLTISGQNVVDKIKGKDITIEGVEQHYKLSKETKDYLLAL